MPSCGKPGQGPDCSPTSSLHPDRILTDLFAGSGGSHRSRRARQRQWRSITIAGWTLLRAVARDGSFDAPFALRATTIGAAVLRGWLLALTGPGATMGVRSGAPVRPRHPCAMPSHQPISYSWTKSHAGWSMPSGSPIPDDCAGPCSSIPARQVRELAARIGVNPGCRSALGGGDLARLRDGVDPWISLSMGRCSLFGPTHLLYGPVCRPSYPPQGFDPGDGHQPQHHTVALRLFLGELARSGR